MKQFKNLILLCMAAAAISISGNAQPQRNPKGGHEKERPGREQMALIQAKRISDELAFDEATSAKFTEAYCEYQREIWALGPKDGHKPDEEMSTEKDAEKALKARFERNEKILDIRKKYYEIYSKFLTQKQIQRVYQIEEKMHGKMAEHKRKPKER